jgi:very-short-patch-repair endonuclease
MSELVTVMSDAHRELVRLLLNWGVELQEEIKFPPYTVDVYVPVLHVAIEADGPQHSRRRDDKRDQYLCEVYDLIVLRVENSVLKHPEKLHRAVRECFEICAESANARAIRCRNKVPWI